jgi:membrane protein implicated in regulation of membrane protease activity
MRALVIPLAVFSAVASALLAYIMILSRHKKSSRKPLRLVGCVASVEAALTPEGFVMIDGELWRARLLGDLSVERGKNVRVIGARDCVLEVEPLG